jgi:superfamily II DNA or RNA helicase/predicted MPP superfamily phosphohydrolase
MKAAWLTDIHLNFLKYSQREDFFKRLSEETADCFLISGDIGEADSIIPFLERIESAVKRPVYFVMGNHDFYDGSIKAVRSSVSDYVKTSDKLIWLNEVKYVGLTKETALIGHDSWADGRLGDFFGSTVELNDFRLIDELKLWDRTDRLKAMQKLADEAEEHFSEVLPLALKTYRHIIVLTHVPPFKEATWHQGQISGDEWLPLFSCQVVGEVFKSIMEKHPSYDMTVLCGHTHSPGECQILPNLKVLTGKAEYGDPQIQRIIEIDAVMKNENQYLSDQVNDIDAQIASLKKKKEKLLSRFQQQEVSKGFPSRVNNLSAPHEKIALFRSLFRGREDVYAHRWVSKKTGKSGYSFVCKNEWAARICQKPRIKCSECPHREFVALDDEVLRKHFQGVHTVGVYPMLKNENCFFLAVDFDKEGWSENVFAFRDTCLTENVPVAIERSRSGNGAHAWIFFEEEIPASMARKLGSYLITKTMSKRYQMDMKSYDRLFPNQDTLPKGGFGNLIVLPFQKEASRHGNSLFIDEHCQPFADQWAYLASIQKMSYKDVEKIAGEASKSNQVVGVRMSPVDEDDPPWMQLPSGKKRFKTNIADLPSRVEIVIANRVYIKTESVPSLLLNQLKRLAAFQNPEFYKRQNMRFSTHATPRVICCAEIVDGYLSLPRGCLENVLAVMEEYGVQVEEQDERVTGKKIKSKFSGQLTRMQQNLVKKVLKHDVGILVAPPGVGKTVMAIHTIAKRKTNVLILVHRKPLLEQWRMQLASFLGMDIKEIGQIGSGKNSVTGNIDVGMVQSMERKGVVDDCIIDYGFVIVDECHHISAVSFERVLMQAKAKYVLGLTATPYRSDGHQPIIHMQCGPVVAKIKQSQATQQISQFSVVSRMTEFQHDWTEESKITELWPELINDIQRNEMIANDVIDLVKEGRFPVVLTERREHLKTLEELIKPHVDQLTVLYGGLKSTKKEETIQEFRGCSDAKSKVLLATGSYLGEGFDDPRLDTLLITMPVSFKGKIVQYAGRLHRDYHGKRNVLIYDYVDQNVSILNRMYQKRLKIYKAMGYEV